MTYCCEESSFTREERASERGICERSGLPPVPSKHLVDCGGSAPSNYQCNVMAHKISLDCLRTVWKGPTTVVEGYPTRAIRPLQTSRSQIEGRMHKKIGAIGRLNPIV